jgi:hypothetical protein
VQPLARLFRCHRHEDPPVRLRIHAHACNLKGWQSQGNRRVKEFLGRFSHNQNLLVGVCFVRFPMPEMS